MAISRELPENIDWIDKLLHLALSTSDISATNQKLALKILSCLQYIHHNKTLIALAVEMRLAKSEWWFKYRKDTINDYELGILRDDNGTSFHIGYFKSPEEAIHLLSFKINEFNQMLAQTPQSKWPQVIEKFGDGGTNGCIEARIRPAVDWMIQQLNNHHTLTNITTECENLLIKQGKHDPSVQEVVRFILKYCHQRGITACEQGNIDSTLLTGYIKSLDLYREDNEEAIPKSPLHQLTAAANIKIGYTGMIQYHYPTLDEANALVAWLKQQKELDTLNINKVTAKLEKDKYIVRVTQAQLDQINNRYQLEQQEIQTLADLFFQLSDDVTKNIGIQRNLLSRIASISPSVASQALIRSNNKSTPLHLAFQHASEPVLLALLTKTSPEAINQALMVQNDTQWTPLHLAFQHASKPVLLALLAKASPEVINQALMVQNDTQWTPLHLAFQHASKPVLLALLAKASPEAINQALMVQNDTQWTPLHIAFQHASKLVLLALLAKASPEAINQALMVQNNEKFMPLHIAFQHASEPVLLALLAKASPEAINQALIVQSTAKWAPLHLAFQHASEPVLLTLLTKASLEAINQALIVQRVAKWIPLHLAFRYASEPVLLALLTKASPEAINQALIVQNVAQWTPLHTAFRYASASALLALLAKASPEAISQALMVQNNEKFTPLHLAFEKAFEPVLLTLLAKASREAISQALIAKNDKQATPLHLALKTASEPVLLALLAKASCEAISQAVVIQNLKYRTTPLHVAFSSASEPVLLALLARISPKVISQALIIQNNISIPLDYLFSRTIPSLTLLIIDSLPKEILDNILKNHSINLANIFENASPPLSFLIIETLITKCGIEAFRNFSIFNPIQRKYNPQYLIQLIFSSILKSEVVKYELPVFMLEALFNAFPSLKDLLFNRWAHNGKVPPSIEQYFLEKYLDPSVTTDNEAALANEEDASQEILKKIQANQVLIKMFSPQRWDILLNSLADYQYRAPLRDLASKSQATHKFFHATNEIKPYQPQKDYLKQYQATKKTPCTLLSQDMSGVLFGEKQANASGIGLMFDANQCDMKTMLKYDRGTYSRGWLGSLEVVLSYQKQLVSNQLNFPDIASFQAHVNASSSINEVLACFKREAILCIAMTDESLTTIHLAEKYQADILAKMNTTIPIMFYDREKGCVTDLQHTQEYLSRAKIRTLKETIQAKTNWSKAAPSVLGLTLFYKSNTPTAKAAEIIKLIEQQEAQPISWLKFETKIWLSLDELTSTQPASRHDDTHSFYKSVRHILN